LNGEAIVTKRSFVLIFLLLPFVSCSKSGGQSTQVEITQPSYERVIITVFRESGGRRTFLIDKDVRITLLDKESSVKTNSDGQIYLSIPYDLSTRIHDIVAVVDGSAFSLKYKTRTFTYVREVQTTVHGYNKVSFNITQQMTEKPLGENASPSTQEVPFKGKVAAVFGGGVSKTEYTGNGQIDIVFNDEEMRKLVSAPSIALHFEEGEDQIVSLDLPQPTGKVDVIDVDQTRTEFHATIFNGTFKRMSILLRAGYVRYGDEWFIGSVVSRKYFEEKEFILQPGEKQVVSLSYPAPLISARSLKYKIIEAKEIGAELNKLDVRPHK